MLPIDPNEFISLDFREVSEQFPHKISLGFHYRPIPGTVVVSEIRDMLAAKKSA